MSNEQEAGHEQDAGHYQTLIRAGGWVSDVSSVRANGGVRPPGRGWVTFNNWSTSFNREVTMLALKNAVMAIIIMIMGGE